MSKFIYKITIEKDSNDKNFNEVAYDNIMVSYIDTACYDK
ncbi:Uncharacterised protein [Staphylococcus saccharolyticus]|uniref:Uncharacterized protein n=1 Tax=Staphylococcus saccharolyticus TaxID=33028 RepID=A0A380H980_9STAP|nr:Uncharacterised protein [Staphylococcus saccharolyticus]